MLTIHHLHIGRSIFTVWLLEELQLDYQVKEYFRDPVTLRAGDDLKVIHPLGKSPVIEEDGLVLSESGAITQYLLEKYDTNKQFLPTHADGKQWAHYLQWLHYPEGSVFGPLLMKMLLMRSKSNNTAFEQFSAAEIALHLRHIQNRLQQHSYVLGDAFSGADFGITYVISMAQRLGLLSDYPVLQTYLEKNLQRPAFIRAQARVGD